ncbi:MAG: FeoB small GTPase domain-containing protein [Syntrophomonadaceae bacterium]|jgi:ferrous iron transport protein B
MRAVFIGNPNVGKSALINQLTGSRLLVANYPGTSHKIASVEKDGYRFYDTPGIYSLHGPGESAAIVRQLLRDGSEIRLVNVVDATNLERNLVLTLEILALGLPTIVVLNQMDRAANLNISIERYKLAQELGCPVILLPTPDGSGLNELMQWIRHTLVGNDQPQPARVDNYILPAADHQCQHCTQACRHDVIPLGKQTYERARTVAAAVTHSEPRQGKDLLETIQKSLDHPVLGTILLLLLAYGLFYVMITLVHYLEGPISELLAPISGMLTALIQHLLPPGMINQVLSQAVPEGLVIPFTIIMPAMITVSIFISVLEDTGLLPRYSVALERVTSFIGVSGQAIIPLTLGFGCRTPAIMATSLLPNAAERFIIATLLSIVVPCAASLGVMAAVIAKFHAYLWAVVAAMLAVLLGLGYALSRIMPREGAFIYELPPLRIPAWKDVGQKVISRCGGFFTEVLPLLLLMNIILRAMMETGVLTLVSGLEGMARLLFGIPAEALVAVLITVLQRYLAPLVLLNLALTPREATIAITMIALSLPCLPVMTIITKEMGLKNLFTILGLGVLSSILVGVTLNLLLPI